MGQPTMEDVAAKAGVSRALVSLVMRKSPRVSEISRAAVLVAAEELGYRPNLMARNLASHRTMTIGVLLDDLHNPFYADVADGLMEAAEAANYRVLLTTGMNRPATHTRALDTLLQLHTDGAILVSPQIPVSDVERVARSMPIVAVAEPLETTIIDTVGSDEELGVELLIEHLWQLGHRRIAHTTGGIGAAALRRSQAYVNTMVRRGLGSESLVIPAAFTERGGYEAAGRILELEHRPTAVFVANDLSAIGALDRFVEAGLKIPDDISIVGYDNTSLAAIELVSLTTIDQPRHVMGQLAFATLMERIEGNRTGPAVHHVLAPQLVVRTSAAAISETLVV
jgi:DNA-binding LacI/PurR family transcriptional regulator